MMLDPAQRLGDALERFHDLMVGRVDRGVGDEHPFRPVFIDSHDVSSIVDCKAMVGEAGAGVIIGPISEMVPFCPLLGENPARTRHLESLAKPYPRFAHQRAALGRLGVHYLDGVRDDVKVLSEI